MGATFNRIKRWLGLDVIQNSDLNAEFDNILNNLGPAGMSGWSSSVAQMQIQTSPGTYGNESLATTTNGEIERIRYQLNAIIGGPDNVWYDTPSASLSELNSSLSVAPPNRIASGPLIASTNMPGHLVPGGGSNKYVTLEASSGSPFVVYIRGTEYTFTSNIQSSTLTLAPSSQNTFAINDSNCDGSAKTQGFGAFVADLSANLADGTQRYLADYPIYGNTVGNSLTALGGTFQGFSYTHSSVTEYFTGYILPNVSSTFIQINKAQRGFFFNSSSTQVPAIGLHNSDNVTLCQLVWIYITTAGTLLAVYTHPRYSPVQPSSSLSGDMWYDMVNQEWKQSNGSTYSVANAQIVGVALTNTSGCIAARSFDWYKTYNSNSNVVPDWYSTTEYRTKYDNNQVNVYGNQLNFITDELRWNTNNYVSGLTPTSGTCLWMYLDQTGAPNIDVIQPNRRLDLGGYYHPAQTWRCMGAFLYNASSQFDQYAFSNMAGLINSEYIADKTISVSKRKTSQWVQYVTSAASPNNADLDQVSYSTNLYLPNGTASGMTQIEDNSSSIITCSLKSSGRPILIGLDNVTNNGAASFSLSNSGGNTSSVTAVIGYYVNGVQSKRINLEYSAFSSTALSFPIGWGATWTLIPNVPPGLNTYTVSYSVSGINPSLSIESLNLFVMEMG